MQEFIVDLPLQLGGLVCILGRSPLPVHSAGAQPASVEAIRAHPQEHASLQSGRGTWGAVIGPSRGREAIHRQGHYLRTASLRVVFLLRGAGSEMAAFRAGDGHLPHQIVPVKHAHVQPEIWGKQTDTWRFSAAAFGKSRRNLDFLKVDFFFCSNSGFEYNLIRPLMAAAECFHLRAPLQI